MTSERTLSIIKPDATERNLIGKIITKFEEANLKIIAARLHHLSKAEAGQFYAVHRERSFFDELVTFMSRAPVFISVLEGENAVEKHREIMGATDPAKATPGTVRADFALNIGENSVHGSDTLENAHSEVAFFFPDLKA